MVNYGEAFKLPFSNWKRTGIFFLISLVASVISQSVGLLVNGNNPYEPPTYTAATLLLIIPLYLSILLVSFFTIGYELRVTGLATRGQNAMPPFQNLLGMLGRGFQYFIAIIIYIIPFAMLFGVSMLLTYGGLTSGSGALSVVGMVLMIPLIIVGLLFFAYVFPVIMAHFAHEEGFAAWFSIGKSFKYSFSTAYFVPWLVALGYGTIIGIVYLVMLFPLLFASVVNPYFGYLQVPVSALFSIAVLPIINLYGQAYRDAAGLSAHAAPAVKRRAAKK